MAQHIDEWLEALGLGRYSAVFAEADVDLEILPRLSDDDLKEMGLAVGARRRIQVALEADVDVQGSGDDASETGDDQAERRQLTLMFCDLVGSTELSTRIDAEDMRAVLKVFQDVCNQEVERFGGYVAKFMGDGALAYFGYPEAHEDDAERAINSGLSLVSGMAAANCESGRISMPPVRVGIATGFVVVGDVIGRDASQEAAVVGETPNLAARLQGLAEPDTVIIDAATEELAGGHFVLRDLGTQTLKGFADACPAWSVAGIRRVESRFAAAHGERLSTLVGRVEELELLKRRWQRAQSGEGQLVIITGEPGIGKSRLVHGALEAVASEPQTRIRYQCSPFHTNSPLYPAIGQLELATGIESTDAAVGKLDKLEALIARAGRSIESDAPVLAALLSIPLEGRHPPLAVTPQRQKALVIETLVGHLVGLAAKEPVLFVIEDAHWMDPTTLELMDRGIEALEKTPALMLLTHRPDFVPPWTGRHHVSVVTLNRLAHRECAQLAMAVSGGPTLSAPVVEQIVVKTDGVPLFVEEFTRAALESEAKGQQIAIPTTLKDALEARLSRLGEGHDLALVAAVIGRSFGYRLLSAVYDRGEAALELALQELVDAQLLFVRGTPPESSYTFKHALVQDTAYDSLLRKRRVRIHERVAEILENQFPDVAADEPEVLAHHLTQAEHPERAIEYWQKAGEMAARRFSNKEAVHHFEKALELVSSLPEERMKLERELALQIHLAPVHMATIGFNAPEAERAYRRALELAKGLDDTDSMFKAQWGIWMMHLTRGTSSRPLGALFELSDTSGDPEHRFQACHAAWSTAFLEGDLDSSARHTEEGLRTYEVEKHAHHRFLFGGHDPGMCCRSFRALTLFLQGSPDTAVSLIRQAVTLAEGLEHPPSLIVALIWQSHVHLFRGEPEQARFPAERAIALGERHGVPTGLWGNSLRGAVASQEGRHAEGLEIMARSFDAFGSVGQEGLRSFFLGMRAEVAGRAGVPEEGLEYTLRGLQLAEKTKMQWSFSELHRIRGDLLHQLGRSAEDIESCYRQSLEFAGAQGALFWTLRAATSLARYRAARGDVGDAPDLLAAAYEQFTEGLETADLREARRLLQELGR